MPDFRVTVHKVVRATVDVSAERPADAAEDVESAPDMPGAITLGAFGGSTPVDEAGDWEAVAVTDAAGNVVWQRPVPPEPVGLARLFDALASAYTDADPSDDVDPTHRLDPVTLRACARMARTGRPDPPTDRFLADHATPQSTF